MRFDLFVDGQTAPADTGQQRLALPNDADPREANLAGVGVVELHFPRFTDGRAYSQAALLRQRLGFVGEIRATGDVLVDQLLPMRRCGFTQAVLRADQRLSDAQAALQAFSGHYQGDALHTRPRFAT